MVGICTTLVPLHFPNLSTPVWPFGFSSSLCSTLNNALIYPITTLLHPITTPLTLNAGKHQCIYSRNLIIIWNQGSSWLPSTLPLIVHMKLHSMLEEQWLKRIWSEIPFIISTRGLFIRKQTQVPTGKTQYCGTEHHHSGVPQTHFLLGRTFSPFVF